MLPFFVLFLLSRLFAERNILLRGHICCLILLPCFSKSAFSPPHSSRWSVSWPGQVTSQCLGLDRSQVSIQVCQSVSRSGQATSQCAGLSKAPVSIPVWAGHQSVFPSGQVTSHCPRRPLQFLARGEGRVGKIRRHNSSEECKGLVRPTKPNDLLQKKAVRTCVVIVSAARQRRETTNNSHQQPE